MIAPFQYQANVLSLTQHANDWLTNSRQPRILHVFDSAVNLINENRDIISAVTPQIGNGPFNLVVKDEISFSESVGADSKITILGDRLVLGELTIDTGNAELWSPRPDWEFLHTKSNKTRDSLLSLELESSTGTTLRIPNYHSLVFRLCFAVANADISSSIGAAEELAGLGAGLTPAGDDVMLGAVYAAWIIHPAELATSLAQAIARTASSRTASLSAAWLRAAARGETGILWHQFFAALSADQTSRLASLTDIQEAMQKILEVGETSGADALEGFIQTFRCHSGSAGA